MIAFTAMGFLKALLGGVACLGVLWGTKRFIQAKSGGHKESDRMDCYFDPECHAMVDWGKVGDMKRGFFDRLKMLKESHDAGAVETLIEKAHNAFKETGMPDDKIDYMLTKWIESTFPEALDLLAEKTSILVDGFSCSNGYGRDVNQEYIFQGRTKDGRPYYRGSVSPNRYIYFDKYCADDTNTPRWLLGQEPSVERSFDLNANDGKGCFNDFGIETDSRHLPAGRQQLAWQWCGDHGYPGAAISIAYRIYQELPMMYKSFPDQCAKYATFGELAIKGCHACEKWYPGQIDECMGCGKECSKICPAGSDFECYKGNAYVQCHRGCMAKKTTKQSSCSKYEPWGAVAVSGCRECEKWYPKEADKCMGCGKACSKICPAGSDSECYRGAAFVKCHQTCMTKQTENLSVDPNDCFFDKECHAKVDWNVIAKLKESFFTDIKKFKSENAVGAVKDLMTRTHAEFVKAGMPDDRVDYILMKWKKVVYPEDQKTGHSCSKYEAFGALAVKGCHACEKWYPGQTDECMGCGKECSKICPAGSDFECYKGNAYVQCHRGCMAKKTTKQSSCSKYEPWGAVAVSGCRECEKWYPKEADKCMGCGKACSKICPAGSDSECYRGAGFVKCHQTCMTKQTEDLSGDPNDCFFDKECHAKVDWNVIAKLKESFFTDIKKFKSENAVGLVKNLVVRMHAEFVKAGMPDDRVGYLLVKWAKTVFPEGLETKSDDIILP